MTAPTNEQRGEAFSVAVWGDMGVSNSQGSFDLLKMLTGQAKFMWHLGDIGYADDCFLTLKTFFSDC